MAKFAVMTSIPEQQTRNEIKSLIIDASNPHIKKMHLEGIQIGEDATRSFVYGMLFLGGLERTIYIKVIPLAILDSKAQGYDIAAYLMTTKDPEKIGTDDMLSHITYRHRIYHNVSYQDLGDKIEKSIDHYIRLKLHVNGSGSPSPIDGTIRRDEDLEPESVKTE